MVGDGGKNDSMRAAAFDMLSSANPSMLLTLVLREGILVLELSVGSLAIYLLARYRSFCVVFLSQSIQFCFLVAIKRFLNSLMAAL